MAKYDKKTKDDLIELLGDKDEVIRELRQELRELKVILKDNGLEGEYEEYNDEPGYGWGGGSIDEDNGDDGEE